MQMKFHWQGLDNNCYFVLVQKPNPLKYCNYALPFPMAIGLPFMPCDLPNQYQLYSTDETYSQLGVSYLTFQQQIGLMQRIIIPASHRPWKITGKDYFQHIPSTAFRNLNLCFSPMDRPEVRVLMDDKYIGKIRQNTIFNCCCLVQKFQQFEIFDNQNQVIYRVCSRNPQRGHLIILPFCNFQTIRYQISRPIFQSGALLGDEEESTHEEPVGEIVHLFNGLAEYTSKNDKYGMTLPENSTEEEKFLIIHCVLLIDYLLFQNF